jgi:hypothetical protein
MALRICAEFASFARPKFAPRFTSTTRFWRASASASSIAESPAPTITIASFL